MAPQGVLIMNPSVSQTLDVPLPTNIIWEKSHNENVETVEGQYYSTHIFVDLKSQRKMKENDQIVWSHIANVLNGFAANGIIVLFFKE